MTRAPSDETIARVSSSSSGTTAARAVANADVVLAGSGGRNTPFREPAMPLATRR